MDDGSLLQTHMFLDSGYPAHQLEEASSQTGGKGHTTLRGIESEQKKS